MSALRTTEPPPRRPRLPRDMAYPPPLDHSTLAGPVPPRYALLINPFYPKDPHASFGKHVLTPAFFHQVVGLAAVDKDLLTRRTGDLRFSAQIECRRNSFPFTRSSSTAAARPKARA